MFSKARTFLIEVKGELLKASWPWDPNEKGFRRYRELANSTMIIVVATLLLGGYIAFFDLILLKIVGWLTRI